MDYSHFWRYGLGLAIALGLGLSGCSALTGQKNSPLSDRAIAKSAPHPSTALPTDPKPTTGSGERMQEITIFEIDPQCQELLPRPQSFPMGLTKAELQDRAIAHIVDQRSNGDFAIRGYRLAIDPQTQVATVDLRLAPDAPRRFSSLSNCEQLALLGSVRRTLLANEDWGIQGVEFQSQGKPLVF